MNRTLPAPGRPPKPHSSPRNNRVADLAAKNLFVLFAGISNGLYTAAIGRPGNRFWPALAEHRRRRNNGSFPRNDHELHQGI